MWQPIETAPKDGTPVLVYESGWDPEQKDQEIAKFVDGYWRVGKTYLLGPSHWHPLPQPPID